MTPYERLLHFAKETRILASIESVLSWDQETYMPSRGIEIRSLQKASLSVLLHKRQTGKPFQKLLAQTIDLKSGKFLVKSSEKEKKALREWRKDFLKEKKLFSAFVSSFEQTTSEAVEIWKESLKKNSFSHFAPILKKIVSLSRKKADLLGYKKHPYDALLDLYEPSLTVGELENLFPSLQKELTLLIKKRPLSSKKSLFQKSLFSPSKQNQLGEKLLSLFPFEKNTIRLDETVHPFTTSAHPTDVRITTKIVPSAFLSSLFSILHEGGHGLYDGNLPKEDYGSPLGEAISYGIHESQSRWWENWVGKSFSFWTYFYPIVQNIFPKQLKHISLENFYKELIQIKPSLIRVEADEVTYSLHVILRYELEKKLIEGSLRVEEIPEYWNHLMKEFLGVCPSNDKEGCLQDVHWSCGYFGYFPSYALGNLYAAQFFQTFARENPSWEQAISKGNFSPMALWLKRKIHSQGRYYSASELLEQVTGKKLSEKPFVNYLKKRYLQR